MPSRSTLLRHDEHKYVHAGLNLTHIQNIAQILRAHHSGTEGVYVLTIDEMSVLASFR